MVNLKKISVLFMMVLAPILAMANAPPVIDAFTASKYQVLPGEQVDLHLAAHDPDCPSTCTTGCGLYIREDMTTWTSSGGTYIAKNNGVLGSPYTADAVWQAPETEGNYSHTVQVFDSGSILCGGRMSAFLTLNILVSTAPPNDPPVITSISADSYRIGPYQSALLHATAEDPDSDPVTFEWAVNFGTISEQNGGQARFTAPAETGVATVTLTVRDDPGLTAQQTITIVVSLVTPAVSYSGQLYAPTKLAVVDASSVYVVDGRAGELVLLDLSSSLVEERIPLEGIRSVDVDPLRGLLVGTESGAFLRENSGNLVTLAPPPGSLNVRDVAVDGAAGRYAVLYREGRVGLYDQSGFLTSSFGAFGDGPGQFLSPTSIKFGPSGEIFVADNGHGLILRYDPSGAFVDSFGGLGGNLGEFVQLDSIFVGDDGKVWASDSFKSIVQVFDAAGTLVDSFGGYGGSGGFLKTPSGVLVLSDAGKVLVASVNSQSIQAYSIFAPPPPNDPPTAPVPSQPQEGAAIFTGQPVVLSALNGTDSNGDDLSMEFELYLYDGSIYNMIFSSLVNNGSSGETTLDVTAQASSVGEYYFKARSFDGQEYSAFSPARHFSVTVERLNTPPSTPVLISPAGGGEVADLTPDLLLANSTDPDGDALSYVFEVLLYNGTVPEVVFGSTPVPAGEGTTSWQVPPGPISPSQEIFWRASAYDGIDYSVPSESGAFKTPPAEIPSSLEMGIIPGGDATRPNEIRYILPPLPGDTTLYFELYDTDALEVRLSVNGNAFHDLPGGTLNGWSPVQTFVLPASELSGTTQNLITFTHQLPGSPWGIRNVALFPMTAPLPQLQSFNTVLDVSFTHFVSLDSVESIRIYRSPAEAGPFEAVATIPKDQQIFRSTGLTNGMAYFFRGAYVYGDDSEGGWSSAVSGAPLGGAVTPITDLMIRKFGSDIVLSWTPITNDPPFHSYELYSGDYSDFASDMVNFSNLVSVIDPAASTLTLYGKTYEGSDSWFNLVPFDGVGLRGLP